MLLARITTRNATGSFLVYIYTASDSVLGSTAGGTDGREWRDGGRGALGERVDG